MSQDEQDQAQDQAQERPESLDAPELELDDEEEYRLTQLEALYGYDAAKTIVSLEAEISQYDHAEEEMEAEITRLAEENARLRNDLSYFDSAFDTVLDEVADLQHQMTFLMSSNSSSPKE